MSGKYRDLTGMKFGRLVVIERAENSWDNKPMWRCVCECGEECVKYGSALTMGYTKSCGCYRRELATTSKYVHGGCSRHSRDRLYAVWNMMKQRCNDTNNKAYPHYGGRGIKVCQEWDDSYEAFRLWALANGYDSKAKSHDCTIDRIDNSENYEPSNCRWVSAREQANNTRKNHTITYNGETHTIAEWSRITGICRGTIQHRLKMKWAVKDMLTIKPVKGANQNVKRDRTYTEN